MGINSLSAVACTADITVAIHRRDSDDITGKSGANPINFEKEMSWIDPRLTSDFLQKTIDRVNEKLFGINREFNYSVHKDTGQFMVKILDSETKEVIREIPPEKNLDYVAKMLELAGIFLDEKI